MCCLVGLGLLLSGGAARAGAVALQWMTIRSVGRKRTRRLGVLHYNICAEEDVATTCRRSAERDFIYGARGRGLEFNYIEIGCMRRPRRAR